MFAHRLLDNLSEFEPTGVSKYPPTDLSYSKDSELIFVEVALAGFQKEDLDIRTENNLLIISSEGIQEDDSDGVEFIQKNIARRSFKRIIKLDNTYIGGEIKASMDDGLLTISIKPNKSAINQIEIA